MTYDASTNLDFMEFCTKAKILGITCLHILVEAYWSIGKVKKYHASVRCVYDII